MRMLGVGVALASVLLISTPAAAQVRLSINSGRVTLSATNATVSQILAEWARIGQTRIVNGERVPGGPLTLELKDVPEVEALEILLRSAGGYLLAARTAAAVNLSHYDRILIVPVGNPVSIGGAGANAARPPFSQPPPTPAFPQPQLAQPPSPQLIDDNPPPDRMPPPDFANTNDGRGPAFSRFPPPQTAQPQQPAPPPAASGTTVGAPAGSPQVPAGVSVPGMAVPAPAQGAKPTEGTNTTPRR